MGRLFTYMIITVGILALFSVAGLYQSGLLDTLGLSMDDMQNQSSSWFYIKILFYIGLLGGSSAIVIGFFGGTYSDIPITALFAVPLALFIVSLSSLSSSIDPTGSYGFVKIVVWLIFSPLIVGYLMSLYDWVRGRD